ncbi:MAG: coproporphyrinogen III oxidase [Archangium sp.]
MSRALPSSSRTRAVLELVERLQQHFAAGLASLDVPFPTIEWLRDEGRHGGGQRYAIAQSAFFNRASVNVSCVHYQDDASKPVTAATALSAIVHPRHPLAPSLHLHVSFTEPRGGEGTWRLMTDLNPSHRIAAHTARFTNAMSEVLKDQSEFAREEGERYFFIPALHRTRGVTHFYLEQFKTDDAHAARFARTAIDTYLSLLRETPAREATADEQKKQREYHTLYLFQVLTLDRGTTSGLLAHDQNDVGVMGSLPSFIDRALLASWAVKSPRPQDELVRALVKVIPDDGHVTDDVRAQLAKTVRAHYRANPDALSLQASGSVTPR